MVSKISLWCERIVIRFSSLWFQTIFWRCSCTSSWTWICLIPKTLNYLHTVFGFRWYFACRHHKKCGRTVLWWQWPNRNTRNVTGCAHHRCIVVVVIISAATKILLEYSFDATLFGIISGVCKMQDVSAEKYHAVSDHENKCFNCSAISGGKMSFSVMKWK